MAIPPAGVTEPHPTNTQETPTIFSDYDFRPRIPAARKRRRRGLDGEENEPIANPEFATGGESIGRVTNQDVRQYFNSFNEALQHQTEIIETARAEVQELKAEQQLLRTHNKELREEIQALRARLETQPLNTPVHRSWAEVARWQPSARPRENHEDVDNDRFSRALPTEAANTHIRTALLNAETTKEVQVAGIGTTKTGYVIRFRDTQSAETARNSTEWLEELGNNTKVVKPRFGIVVHRVPTEDFELEGNKKQGMEKIMAENDLHDKKFRVEDIAWLKKRDMPLGKLASMGVCGAKVHRERGTLPGGEEEVPPLPTIWPPSLVMQGTSEVRTLRGSPRPASLLPRNKAKMLGLQWRTPNRRPGMPGIP
ncbi:hypothetical protein AAWM_08747 [Aspergillus awamori]|uniref:Uncharacterized protein n=1 Tax=Aspergillus awamori TaxID=105351 RepID=A0A401L2Y4_ASPAW|nr:hypothetical protein AAWM_08747 [Aspergillus awamori]